MRRALTAATITLAIVTGCGAPAGTPPSSSSSSTRSARTTTSSSAVTPSAVASTPPAHTLGDVRAACADKLPGATTWDADSTRFRGFLGSAPEDTKKATTRVDAMLAKVADLKSLLLERRAALITDVVTGKKEVA